MGVCLLAALAVLSFQFRAAAVPKPIGTVSGSVVNSCAGSGNLTGDAGIAGISVSLSSSTVATVTTTTAANGSFSFTNVVAGAYVLTVNPPAQYVETYPAGVTNNKVQVSVTPGQTTTTNFGYAFSSPPTIIYTPPVTSSIALGSQAECTATESQWAGAPSGNDAGAVLASNFPTVFPSGVTIGYAGGFTVNLTSVPAVDAFLSSASGPPGTLSASAVNPASTSAGDFAGEVLALQLSVGFSGAGVFGTGTTLSNLVYYNPSSPLNGYGLGQILNIANIGLGGGNLAPYGVSIDDLETLLLTLNSALTNCTADAFAASSLLIPVSASDVTDSIISNAVTLVEASGGASFTVSHTDTGTCGQIRTFTIQAMNTCGYESSSNVVFALGGNLAAPVISGVPAGGFLGCVGAGQFPAGLPTESAIYGEVSATGLSGSPIIVVTLQDTVNGCSGSRTFTVTVSDICGNLASKQTIYTWDILSGIPTFGGLPAAATNYSCYAQVPPAAQVTATDACGQSLTVNYSSTETAPDSSCNDTITRTWITADCAGQTASFQQVITVKNLIPPTMTAGTIASCYSSVEEATNAALLATSASASCAGTVVLTVSTNGTNCPATITVTATDGCGNFTNVTYTTAILLTAPTFENPPANATYSCYSDVPAMQPLTAMDACGTTWSVTGTSVETAPGSSCNDTITRTWTATDCAGQTTKIQQIITVKNLIPPTMTAGTIASCYASVEEATNAAVQATSASASCAGTVVLTVSTNGTNCPATITVTATDGCGNSTNVTYTTAILLTAPTFENPPANVTYSCYSDLPAMQPLTAMDACGTTWSVTGTSVETAPGSSCNDTITRTWTATDCAGQTTKVQQIITVKNLIPPTMTAGTIASCYASVEEATNAAVQATSASASCAGTVVLTVSTNGTNCPATITVTATDGCGNSTNVTYTTAILLTAPTFENPPANATYSCYSDVPAMQPLTAVDACGTVWSVTGTSVETAPGSSCNDTITRTWTATDCAGQTTKIQQIITVKNLIPPTMTAGTIASCYSSVEAATNAAMQATSASASCAGTVVLTVSTNGTNCPATITVTATDGCGNSTKVTYTTAILLTAPIFENPPANVTYSCYSDVPAMQPLTAMDACGTTWSVTGTSVETAPGSSCNDTITRTWTATDCAGQTTKIQQIITVKNLIPPTMTAGTIASCYSSVEAATNAAMQATSASASCAGTVVLTVSTNGTNCPATITVTATDGCGNSTNVTYTTAILLTAPTFENPPANVTYSCYSDVPAMQPLTAMDACGTTWSVTGTSVETAPGSSCNDTITRTWTATDCAGQTTKIQQIITVKNFIPPTMTAGTIASCYSSVMAATNAAVQATKASAFCSGAVNLTVTTNGLDCPATITVTATDGCGNSAHVTYTAAILPMPPTFENPPANATYSCYSEVPAMQPLTAVDACGTSWAVNGTSMQTAAGSSCNDIITRTWTATDCAGQTTTFIQTIKVNNTNAPTLAHVPTGGYAGCSAADLPTDATVLNGVTATDFCGKPASVTASYVDSVNNCEGTRTFSIVGTDTCGNTVTQTVAYTWTAGTNGPNVVCPPSVTIVTNVCQMYCTFSPSDWSCAPNPGYNNNWGYVSQYYNNWGFGGGWGSCNWGNHDANNWWQSWCNTNPVSACWPSWTNWWSQSASPTNGNGLWTTWCTQRPTNCWGSWSANNQSANNGNWWNGWNGGNQTSYGWVPCSGNNPGGILSSCFNKVYSNGCVRIGSPLGNCWTFTSCSAVTNCLGFGGSCGVLTNCATNPASCKSGAFCAQVLALQLNCDLGDYGCVPGFFGKCGDLVLTCPASPCNGCKVRDVLSLCNGVLGGAPCPAGCTVSNLCGLLTNLNQCFEGCRVSPWCSSNLAQVYIPPASVTGTATATATCSPVAILTNYDTILPTSCSNTYVIERVWAAVDGCGNSNYCTQLITVAQSGLIPGAELTKTGPATATVSNTLVYTFTVTNNGNSAETLQVIDPLLGGAIFSQSNVAPGQGFAFTESYTPKTSGNLTNTAWAIGTVPGGKSVTNYSTAITCITTKCVTNQICSSFNSQNEGSGYVWFNAHLNCNPGKACAFYCSNAIVTLSCADGKVYTFPVPNCQVNFTNCSSGSCSYNGSSWSTEIPSAGDSECFLSGFGIPWQADFANCHSVCWTGVFSCSTPGVSCNWQWSAACYNCDLSNCGAINVKPCHDNPSGYQNGDHAGTPENCTSHCQPGACGGGGGNYTGSWSGTGSFTCH